MSVELWKSYIVVCNFRWEAFFLLYCLFVLTSDGSEYPKPKVSGYGSMYIVCMYGVMRWVQFELHFFQYCFVIFDDFLKLRVPNVRRIFMKSSNSMAKLLGGKNLWTSCTQPISRINFGYPEPSLLLTTSLFM